KRQRRRERPRPAAPDRPALLILAVPLSIHRTPLDSQTLSRAALTEAENRIGPMLLDRSDELILIEADGKYDFLDVARARKFSKYFLRDVGFELFVRPEAVDENAHDKRRGGLLARPFYFGESGRRTYSFPAALNSTGALSGAEGST